MAKFERELTRERVRAGLKAAKQLGRCGGRPRRLYSQAEAIEMHTSGMSIQNIAGVLGVGRGTIQRLLGVQKPLVTVEI